MPLKPGNPPYRWLAEYYDRIFATVRTPIDLARQEVLGPILPGVTTACDLACGTGTTAIEFADRGIRMYGVDLSPAMCRLARSKAKKAQVPLRVVRADMRDFELPEAVDLVVCEGDALNHVPRQSDLRLVAESVARALRPGGYFYFDVNNRSGFARYWPLTQWIETLDVAVVLHGGHDRILDRAWTDVEWFLRDGKRWQRRHERVEEVCWDRGEIRSTLRAAGFARLRRWDAAPFFGNGELVRPGCRTVWLARKGAS